MKTGTSFSSLIISDLVLLQGQTLLQNSHRGGVDFDTELVMISSLAQGQNISTSFTKNSGARKESC